MAFHLLVNKRSEGMTKTDVRGSQESLYGHYPSQILDAEAMVLMTFVTDRRERKMRTCTSLCA